MVAITAALVLSAQTYKHDAFVTRDGDGYPISTIIKVSRSSGGLVWKRQFRGRADVRWSEDRRAVAIYGDLGFLTTWVAGEKVKRSIIPRTSGPWEAPENFTQSASWSPDNERLLVIFPRTQGDMILRHGELVILNLATYREQLLGYVDRAEWIDRRTVRYFGRKFENVGEEIKTIPFGPIDKQVN